MPRQIESVTSLTARIRDSLEGEFADVWVEGEISNLKPAPSGHSYFTLKDAGAQLRAVLFRNTARFLKFKPEDGLAVVAHGRLTVYDPRGEYQLVVDMLEPAGLGALQLAFEQLKERLAKEGLFEAERKKPLPRLPQRIGLLTSPRGAVIADMVRILQRRFENLNLLLYPVRVQGEGAADDIVRALAYFNLPAARQLRGAVDVIILARGGGSLEDLWAFNEERVARAIAASRIPVISAVGHESDFTIADFVADVRAPTPSAAAEMVIQTKERFSQEIRALREALEQRTRYRLLTLRHRVVELAAHRGFEGVRGLVRRGAQQVDELDRRLRRMDIRLRLQRDGARTADSTARLQHALRLRLERERGRVDSFLAQLQHLSPVAVLERGYALVYGPEGRLLRDAAEVKAGDLLDVRLHKGRLAAEVKKEAGRRESEGSQPELFPL